jgi:hypothetical protein
MKNVQILRLALVGVAVTGLLVLPANGQPSTVRYYGATIAPTSVAGGTTTPYSLTIENCNGLGTCDGSHTTTSSQSMGSATVAVPAGWTVDSGSLSVSATGGKTWDASLVATTIQLVANPGTQKLDPGESLTLTFNATSPCDTGSYEWTTVAFNGTNFTTSYDLVGSQPSVTVDTGCAEPPSEFQPGDYCSYTQGGWGAGPSGNNPGQILASNFGFVYPSGVTAGTPFWMKFTTASAVDDYLPAGGTPGQLTSNLIDPTSTSAGVFGGQVLALKLNVDLNDAGIIDGTQGSISSLVLTGTGGSLDGQTVAAILAAAEQALGGGSLPSGYTISTLNSLIDLLNKAFDECAPSEWVQTHLIAP